MPARSARRRSAPARSARAAPSSPRVNRACVSRISETRFPLCFIFFGPLNPSPPGSQSAIPIRPSPAVVCSFSWDLTIALKMAWHETIESRGPNPGYTFVSSAPGLRSESSHEKDLSTISSPSERSLPQWFQSLLADAAAWADENPSRGDFFARLRDWFCSQSNAAQYPFGWRLLLACVGRHCGNGLFSGPNQESSSVAFPLSINRDHLAGQPSLAGRRAPDAGSVETVDSI